MHQAGVLTQSSLTTAPAAINKLLIHLTNWVLLLPTHIATQALMLLGNPAVHICELHEGSSRMPLHRAAAAVQAKAGVEVNQSGESYTLAGFRTEDAALTMKQELWSAVVGCLAWAEMSSL